MAIQHDRGAGARAAAAALTILLQLGGADAQLYNSEQIGQVTDAVHREASLQAGCAPPFTELNF